MFASTEYQLQDRSFFLWKQPAKQIERTRRHHSFSPVSRWNLRSSRQIFFGARRFFFSYNNRCENEPQRPYNNYRQSINLYIPTGDFEVGTVIPNMGPCGKHPNFVPEVTEANPNAMASSAACCLFNATFKSDNSTWQSL